MQSAPAADPCANQQPCNDDYINSLELNARGTHLNGTDTLKDVRNTAAATVQSDIFNPPKSGGPAEPTSCHGLSYGHTVWYDFYPDRDGTVLIRTAGYDNVITLYRFDPSSLLPGPSRCVHQPSFAGAGLDAKVEHGHAYTIQIGGAGNASGLLYFRFDFFAKPPHRLSADSTIKASPTSNGIQLIELTVSTARAARVRVSCGRFCRPVTKTGHATESFPRLKGVGMPAGSQLNIRVTAPHSIGVFIQYNIIRGNFTKLTRCMEPGSRKPRSKCH